MQSSPYGVLAVVSLMDEYKKMGEVLFATKMSQKLSGLEQVMTFDTVTFDEVSPTAFEMPKEIKTLLTQKKSGAAVVPAIPAIK